MKVQDRFDENRIGDLVCDGAYKYVQNFAVEIDGKRVAEYDSLDAVTKEWKDYEEPVYYYFIQDDGRIGCDAIEPYNHKPKVLEHKEIGNFFTTREEAERALEKLKAYKRLKDKGMTLKLDSFRGCIDYRIDLTPLRGEEIRKIAEDLELLFGKEEV